uniref:Uncharacterized protein n=1 Tax=Lotus japonicus TaxID=34305 RepID=I3SJG0_LOTJA|nr:unknown [Lotus japonicus]
MSSGICYIVETGLTLHIILGCI